MAEANRHRRARGDWWRELLWPGAVVAVIVWQTLRQWQRERTSVPAAEPGAGSASAMVDRAPRGSGHDSPRAGVPGVQRPLSSGEPIPGLSPELLASWALRRVHRGGVAKSGDHYFDRGRLMLSHLTGALDELVEGGVLALAEEDTWGLRRVSLTAAGHDRYLQLCCPPRRCPISSSGAAIPKSGRERVWEVSPVEQVVSGLMPDDRAVESLTGRWWWGTAASAVQTEGASPADDWYRWERAGNAPPSGDGNGFAHRFREDFALLREIGMTDHRLSINWARVEPEQGRVDQEAIGYYRSVLTAAREVGLRVWVCLLHTAIPVWFADRGGFASEDAVGTWLRWVDLAATTFGDLAGGWMPFNTPTSYAQKGYLTGTFPPGRQNLAEMVTVLGTVHTCDFEAALALRATGKPTCSNEALLPLYPADDTAETTAAMAQLDALVWDSWLTLARHPRYAQAFDLYGFTYYYGGRVTPQGQLLPHPSDQRPGPLGYVPWPEGIAAVLHRLQHELPEARLVVAELGYGGTDDHARRSYLRQALEHLSAAQDQGVRIEGVTLWTGIDNYEWLTGFTVPFGLFDLDRSPRPSARFTQAMTRAR
ncbi:MAG: family 1 glycosylhydrolase [Pseudonocardiaceae bacterium]